MNNNNENNNNTTLFMENFSLQVTKCFTISSKSGIMNSKP